MNKNQWFVLGIFFIAIGSWFIFVDNTWRGFCDISDSSPVNNADIVACVNGEILDPFIWLLIPIGWICFVLGFLEKKKK